MMKKSISVFLLVFLIVPAVFAAGFSMRLGSGYMGTFGNTGYFVLEDNPGFYEGTSFKLYKMAEYKSKYSVNAYMFDFGLMYELKKIPVFVYADVGFGFPVKYKADGEFYSKKDMSGSDALEGLPWTFKAINDFHLNAGVGFALTLDYCPVKFLMGAGFAMEILTVKNENKIISARQRMTNLGLNIRLEGDYMITEDFAVCLLVNPNMMFRNNFRSRLEYLDAGKDKREYVSYGAKSSNPYFSFALQATLGVKYTF